MFSFIRFHGESHRQRRARAEATRCLLSIAAQTTRPTRVLLSWSRSDESIQLPDVPLAHLDARLRNSRLSQFRHFTSLVADLQGEFTAEALANAWVIFSDDDDIWHPNRYSAFKEMAQHARAANATTLTCALKVLAKTHRAQRPQIHSAADVDKLLAAGQAEMHKDKNGHEYFDCAVSYNYLRTFFEQDTPDQLLDNVFCDRRLLTFVLWGGHFIVDPNAFDSTTWLYFYDTDKSLAEWSRGVVVDDPSALASSSNAGSQLAITPLDQQLAKHLPPMLLRAGGPGGAAIAAAIRRNIELGIVERFGLPHATQPLRQHALSCVLLPGNSLTPPFLNIFYDQIIAHLGLAVQN